jgi:N,N-dimethylformamidase
MTPGRRGANLAVTYGTGRHPIPSAVDATRLDLVAEFMRSPLGRHSAELQLMLARMRSDDDVGRLVLLRKADGRLVVAEPGRRGSGGWLEISEVTSEAEAERLAFEMRFEAHTGVRLPGPSALPRGALPPEGEADRLLGYTGSLSVAPDEEISCHVSAPGRGFVDIDIVRMHAGDLMPGASGVRYEVIDSDVSGRYRCDREPIAPGSYAQARPKALHRGDGISLQVTFCPTLAVDSDQVLMSVGGYQEAMRLTLVLGDDQRPAIEVASGAQLLRCGLDLECALWNWYTIVGSWSPWGLSCQLLEAPTGRLLGTASLPGQVMSPEHIEGDVVIAGRCPAGRVSSSQDVREHFNGRLEQPAIVRKPELTLSDVRALARPGQQLGDLPPELARRVVGWWDFSRGIEGWHLPDLSEHASDATIVNLARRAVTGSTYAGSVTSWTYDPSQFAAAHFLRDGLEDCQWPATATWRPPAFVRSGFYAFRLQGFGQVDLVPFFVRRGERSASRQVMVLVPTATYLSYANSRFWWEEPILSEAVHDRLVELGPDDQYLMLHEELGPSSYDVHDDGTDVTHVSSRQPNLFMRTTNRHFEGYVSDLFLIDWLDQIGADYEVATDDDLHAGGEGLLDGVTVVITGTHPEYVSEREFDALAQFQGNGGRVMYLGGNGFQSRVTFNPDRPHIMESRRVPYWKSGHRTASAEHYLASDGILGGHLSAIGREARLLVGVETATMGFDESVPFWRVSDLPDEVSFVFRDLDSDQIGDFGLIGGGVVGQEWDNSAGGELPDGHIVLAVSRDHSMIPPLFGSVREPYHAEMVLVTRDGGGACFSVGSMAWCAALPQAGHKNGIARITQNVLSRFLDDRPL